MIDLARHHIIRIDCFLRHGKHGWSCLGLSASVDAGDIVHVGHDFVDIKLQSPGFQEFIQSRSARGCRLQWVCLGIALRVHHREGSPGTLPAFPAQNELIDGKLGFVRNRFWMDDEQDFYFIINLFHIHLNLFDFKIALQLADKNPRFPSCGPAHAHHGGLNSPKTCKELITPMIGFAGVATLVIARERSYQQLFSLVRQEGNRHFGMQHAE